MAVKLRIENLIYRVKRSFKRFPLTVILLLVSSVFFVYGSQYGEDFYKSIETKLGFILFFGSQVTLFAYLYLESRSRVTYKRRFGAFLIWFVALLTFLEVLTLLYPPFKELIFYRKNNFIYASLLTAVILANTYVGRIYEHDDIVPYLLELARVVVKNFLIVAISYLIVIGIIINLARIIGFEGKPWIIASSFIFWLPVFGILLTSEYPTNRGVYLIKDYKGWELRLIYIGIVFIFILVSMIMLHQFRAILIDIKSNNIFNFSLMAVLSMSILRIYVSPYNSGAIEKYKQIFPWVSIVLHLLIYYYLSRMIWKGGWLESRYVFVLLTTWTTIVTLFYLIPNNLKTVWLLQILTIFFLVASLGGPLSAPSISFYSQSKRLENILEENDMVNGEHIIPTENISREDKIKLTEILTYLYYTHGLEGVPYIPRDFEFLNAKKVLGFNLIFDENEDISKGMKLDYSLDNMAELDIEGYERLVRLKGYGSQTTVEDIVVIREDNLISIYKKDEDGTKQLLTTIDLELMESKLRVLMEVNDTVLPDHLAIEGEEAGIHYKIYFTELHFSGYRNQINSTASFMLLLKEI